MGRLIVLLLILFISGCKHGSGDCILENQAPVVPQKNVNAIPEPMSLGLMLMGLGVMARLRKNG